MDDSQKNNKKESSRKEPDNWWDKTKEELKPENLDKRMKKMKQGKYRFSLWYFLLVIAVLAILNMFLVKSPETAIDYSKFKEKISSGEIVRIKMTPTLYIGYTQTSKEYEAEMVNSITNRLTKTQNETGGILYSTVPLNDPSLIPLLDENQVEYYVVLEKNNYFLDILISWIVPLILLVIIWRFIFKRMGNMGGNNVMSFGQNNAKIVAEEDLNTRFDDVAGCEESKDELIEVVDFLKNPKKYTEIGGKIPKGVLLIGPPGTGKTLIARAVAGEANVTFFKMSGADFVEMFVGVGAARVRDLFKQAREKAPCIIFIDELDAIGKSRAGLASTNDEREQTLNQLLVEMDGFDASSGVIILAATNRPEVLDAALLRPGRFDRQVLVDRPDLLGREAILKIHSKGVKISEEVSFREIAKTTVGFVGADLANIINEAALLAVRANRQEVMMIDLTDAIEKTIAGLEKKNRIINPREREIVAYHETGHALVAAFTPDADPVQKVSIVPRGMGALGYMLQQPTEDRNIRTQDELFGMIDTLLGGRAAEMLIFGKLSTGASNDIEKATETAQNLITVYGMSEKFMNVALRSRSNPYLGGGGSSRDYSEKTQQYIDDEIAKLISSRYKKVLALLTEHIDLLKTISAHLLDEEYLTAEEFLNFIDNDEISAAAYAKRKKADMVPSELAVKTGEKRNKAIKARAIAKELAKENEPPKVDNEHKTENPFANPVELKMEEKEDETE
ncbi:MAG: ATP-dependent zinc metalloprotease FtsH [Spirochaetaceae bacterium]|jgi:cell division protease FtsH|nr:ATP-dependent zinc metalloprotease FtsH [Spirochaetaceae bacterium]